MIVKCCFDNALKGVGMYGSMGLTRDTTFRSLNNVYSAVHG